MKLGVLGRVQKHGRKGKPVYLLVPFRSIVAVLSMTANTAVNFPIFNKIAKMHCFSVNATELS